jgi:hypothetical protein
MLSVLALLALSSDHSWDLGKALEVHQSKSDPLKEMILHQKPRVALVTMIIGEMPAHVALLAKSCQTSASFIDCLIFYTKDGSSDDIILPVSNAHSGGNVNITKISLETFATKMLVCINEQYSKHKKDGFILPDTDDFDAVGGTVFERKENKKKNETNLTLRTSASQG